MNAIHGEMNVIKDQHFFPNIEKLQQSVIAHANKNNAKESAQRQKAISDLLHTVDISKGSIEDKTQIQQAINRTADLVKAIAKFAPEIGEASTMKDMLNQMKDYSAKTQTYYQPAALVASNYQKANAMAAEVIELELKFNAKHTRGQ